MMMKFINKKSQKLLDRAIVFFEEGKLQACFNHMQSLKASLEGVPSYEKLNQKYQKFFKSAQGKMLLEADIQIQLGNYGKASRLVVSSANEENQKIINLLNSRLTTITNEYEMKLKLLEFEGKWYSLAKELQNLEKHYYGFGNLFELREKLNDNLQSSEGKVLILSEKLLKDKQFSKSYSILKANVDNANILRIKKISKKVMLEIEESTQIYIKFLKDSAKSGKWKKFRQSIREDIKRYRGITVFDSFIKEFALVIQGPLSQSLLQSERLLASGYYGQAYKLVENSLSKVSNNSSLSLLITNYLISIESNSIKILDKIKMLEAKGDWYFAFVIFKENAKMSGLKNFDEKYSLFKIASETKEVKSLIEAGREYSSLEKSWKKRKSSSIRKKVEQFIKRNSNIYGERAKLLIR